MRQPAQQLVAAVLEDDRLGDDCAQPGHSIAQPFRHAATVKRQVGTAGTMHHQPAPVGATPEVASGCGMMALAASNNGSSSAALIGT
jgi:hypothetical protein